MNSDASHRHWFHMSRAWLALAAAWLLCGAAWAGTLQGTATYRERIALPPDAVFETELQDVSKAGAPAVVLGRAKLDPAGQPPFRFTIAYDDASVQAGHRYTVRATVRTAMSRRLLNAAG